MGILDFLKKKSSPKVADNGALALDELPPIPSMPDDDISSNPAGMGDPMGVPDGLPPSPSMQDLSQPINSDKPMNEAMSDMPSLDQDISTPSTNDGVNNGLFEKLNADLAAANNQNMPAQDSSAPDAQPVDADDKVPTEEEIKEVLLANEEEEKNLPDFDEETDDADQAELEEPELTEEDAWTSRENSTPVKTESLLLKSIFVEREHYANLLFSLRTVKDDLEKSGPQQRKLSNIDMKLGKEYSKLSTLFENFNENVMIIEHIVSNEKF